MPTTRWLRIACALLVAIPAEIAAQRIALRLVSEIGAEQGGPERLNGRLAVNANGVIAFTLGYDNDDRHVTVLDSTGRLITRLGRQGTGPGEFSAVLALFFADRLIYLSGPGQISAFNLDGRHQWSRSLPPLQLVVGASADSVDLMDARYFADGRGVGTIYRRSLQRGGGDRVLVDGTNPDVRRLARGVDDSTRFPRLAFASSPSTVVIGHAHTYQLLAISADGRTRRSIGAAAPVRRRTPAEIQSELARRMERASQPFKMPDGTFRRNPITRESELARLRLPVSYFQVRGDGLQIDARTGDVFVIEPRGDSTRIVRHTRTGSAHGTVACDNRDGVAALTLPFLALTCSGEEDGERVPVIRLYRVQ